MGEGGGEDSNKSSCSFLIRSLVYIRAIGASLIQLTNCTGMTHVLA